MSPLFFVQCCRKHSLSRIFSARRHPLSVYDFFRSGGKLSGFRCQCSFRQEKIFLVNLCVSTLPCRRTLCHFDCAVWNSQPGKMHCFPRLQAVRHTKILAHSFPIKLSLKSVHCKLFCSKRKWESWRPLCRQSHQAVTSPYPLTLCHYENIRGKNSSSCS